MMVYADKLTDEFKSKRKSYQDFTANLHSLIIELVGQNGLKVVNIEHRTKGLDSFK